MKFNHTAHKELWNWLAENPHLFKDDWHGWSWKGGEYDGQVNECFACEYCGCCFVGEECPLIWPLNEEGDPCCIRGGLFDQWVNFPRCSQERSSLARQIANLPVKPGVECE